MKIPWPKKKLALTKTEWLIILLIVGLGTFLRLYHIEFGLPHSFKADEPEIAEFAIKYTYEIRDIIKNNNYYKLIPLSFVYGTFPTYVYTLATMAFSKFNGLLGIAFEKKHIYIFLRSLNALSSLMIIPATALLYTKTCQKHTRSSLQHKTRKVAAKPNSGLILITLLTALNWKFIVHAHYLNLDMTVTVLMSLMYLFLFLYYENPTTFHTVLAAVTFGLGIGTKVTIGLHILPIIYLFVVKKDFKGFLGFSLVALLIFMLTNPFSIIFSDSFLLRILEMKTKENSLVFDSANISWFKYIKPLFLLMGIPTLLAAIWGMLIPFVNEKSCKKPKHFHIFLTLNFLVYFAFFSSGERLVDRWMLPIMPILMVFTVTGIDWLRTKIATKLYTTIVIVLCGVYLLPTIHLLTQFKTHTPKSEAYIWMRDNIKHTPTKLVITEEGLDPMNKLTNVNVIQVQVYASEGAQFEKVPNTECYDYISIASRPIQWYKNKLVRNEYPFYYEKWNKFEKSLNDKEKFELIKTFELPKPNLIPLSNVFIYKNNISLKNRKCAITDSL
jgi:hypothetical protein